MFLVFITLLIVVLIVVSSIVLGWYITTNLKKNRDANRVRYDKAVAQTEQLSRLTMTHSRQIVKCQSDLDAKMDALVDFIDERTTYVKFEQEQFNLQAKADTLAARREELSRAKELKVALERLMGVALTSRQPASPNDIIAIENVTKRIEELETILKIGSEG